MEIPNYNNLLKALEKSEPEQSPEEEQREYGEVLHAADALEEMFLQKNYDPDRVAQCCDVIDEGLLMLESRLRRPASFFECLPLMNRLIKIGDDYKDWGQSQAMMSLIKRTDDREILTQTTDAVAGETAQAVSFGLHEIREGELKISWDQITEKAGEDLLAALQLLVQTKDDFALNTAIDFFRTYKDVFGSRTQERGSAVLREKSTAFDNFLKSKEFEEIVARTVQNGLKKTQGTHSFSLPLLEEVISRYGLDASTTLRSWLSRKKTPETGYSAPNISLNIYTMQQLEAHQSGLTRFLEKEFGIRNFDRYPEEMLIDQYENRENKEVSYGIILNPADDYSGAFSEDYTHWQKLREQLDGKYSIRIIECESKWDIARALINLDRTYGDKQKVSFALIGGHGTEKMIKFGGDDARHRLHVDDLQGSGVEKVKKFFTENPTIILLSCSTGAESGIAEELSRVMHAQVLAPKTPTSVKDINAQLTDDNIVFSIEWDEPEIGRIYQKGSPKKKN